MTADHTPVRAEPVVVEDKTVQRMAVCRAAQKAGYAATGCDIEGIKWQGWRSTVRAVVIPDLLSRDQDGIELLCGVARRGRDPVIVAMSGLDK